MLKKRTDLALEAAQLLSVSQEVPGIVSHQWEAEGVNLTVVQVRTPDAGEKLGKPVGRYVTVDLAPAQRREPGGFGRVVRALAEEIRQMLPKGEGAALVVCLGNRRVTPDALGPICHDHLLVTRHLTENRVFHGFRPVAAISTGVLGGTGVESGDQVAGLVEKIKPSVVIAVDALAGRSLDRLCATVQVANTGISPGSGVGNHRQGLNEKSLGVPVIAIGVPTVVEGATLAAELLEEAGKAELEPEVLRGRKTGLFVTPRDIDSKVAECGKIVAYAIDLALQPGLSLEDLELLLE